MIREKLETFEYEEGVSHNESNEDAQPKTILHIEDDKEWQIIVRQIVEELGFRYECAIEGDFNKIFGVAATKLPHKPLAAVFDLRYKNEVHTTYENSAWLIRNARRLLQKNVQIFVLSAFVTDDLRKDLKRVGIPVEHVQSKDTLDDELFQKLLLEKFQTIENLDWVIPKLLPDSTVGILDYELRGAIRVADGMLRVRGNRPYKLQLSLQPHSSRSIKPEGENENSPISVKVIVHNTQNPTRPTMLTLSLDDSNQVVYASTALIFHRENNDRSPILSILLYHGAHLIHVFEEHIELT